MTFRRRPGSDRSLGGPVQSFYLDEELARLRGEKEWKAGDRLEEHAAPGPIALVVREGRIRFAAGDEAGTHRSMEALGDTVCLPTIAGGGEA